MFSVIHFDPVIKNQSANVELPISMNFKVQVTETIYYTVLNYVQDVGAYLSIFFYIFWMIATVIGSMLVVQYIKQLKSLI